MNIKWAFLSVVTLFCSCNNINRTVPTAQLLNDSVIRITKDYKDTTNYSQAMSLIREAIRLDSSYLKSYSNKLYFEETTGRFDSAFETLKSMIKLRPDSAELYLKAGVYRDIVGDTLEAQEYYRRSLPRYTILIDTLKKDNPERHNIFNLMYMNVILMGQENILHDILKEDGGNIDSISLFFPILRKTRSELINEGRKKYFR